MARTINLEENTAKRNEILDAAERLIYSKGYERMTIQDILSELQMSSGAFYHYFGTKPAVLEAVIERMQQGVEEILLPIVHDPQLPALEKFQQFFNLLERSSTMKKAFVADLLRVWFADENAIVREKVYAAMTKRRAPLLTHIIYQGIREGVFTTLHSDQTAEIILSMARGMGSKIAKYMVEGEDTINLIVATYAAYLDALERILGAPMGFLFRPNADAVRTLVVTLQKG